MNGMVAPKRRLSTLALSSSVSPSSVARLLKLHIDDPVGAVGVHGASAVWGLLAVGLFADGELPGGLGVGVGRSGAREKEREREREKERERERERERARGGVGW